MEGDLYDALDTFDESIAEGAFDEAEATLERAREAFGEEPELVAARAELAYERENWRECVEFVDERAGDLPETYRAELFGLKGYSLYYGGRDDEAREAFNRAVGLDPELWMAILGRSMVHEHHGFSRAALLDLDRAVEIDDQEPEPFAIRGTVHLEFGNREEAERDFSFAVEIDPGDEESRLGLARLQAADDRPSEAIETLEPLVEEGVDPDFVLPGALLRSQMAMTHGNTELAAEDARVAIEARPEAPWGYLQLAAVRLSASEPGDAIAALKEAEERIEGPRDVPDLFSLRATAYEQLGKEEKAAANRDAIEGTARLPEVVYGPELNPAEHVPINPNRPVDVRTVLEQIFGDPDAAPEGYADQIRNLLDEIPKYAEEHPEAGQVEIKLPPIEPEGESPGQIVLQLDRGGGE